MTWRAAPPAAIAEISPRGAAPTGFASFTQTARQKDFARHALILTTLPTQRVPHLSVTGPVSPLIPAPILGTLRPCAADLPR